MQEPALFVEKRVGDFFPLSAACSLALLSVACDAGERVDRALLLDYVFTVRGRLHRYGVGEATDSAVALRYRFGGDDVPDELVERSAAGVSSELRFSDAGTTYALTVRFIALPGDEVADAGTRVTFARRELATGELLLGAKEKQSSSSEDSTTQTTTSEESTTESESSEEENAGLTIFILGTRHDRAEEKLGARLPDMLHHVDRVRARTPDCAVFWEAEEFLRASARLSPPEAFALACYSLPLEGALHGNLQMALSAYTLYLVGRRQNKRVWADVMAAHAYTEEDARRYHAAYGRDGLATLITLHLMRSFLLIAMQLGRQRALDAFLFVHQAEDATEHFLTQLAELYVEVALDARGRAALQEARLRYYADARNDRRDAWYFTQFFANYLGNAEPAKTRDAARVRDLLRGLVRRLMRGPDNPEDLARLDRAYTPPIARDGGGDEALGDALDEWAREAGEQEGAEGALDESYFARLNELIYRRYGHLGASLFMLLEEAVGDNGRALDLGDLLQQYRDMQSFLHVVHSLRATGTRRALLVVGAAHVRPLTRLFRASSAVGRCQSYTLGGAVLAPYAASGVLGGAASEWHAMVQVYLACEVLDAWLYTDVGSPTRPRLQLYYFLDDVAARLQPALYSRASRGAMRALKTRLLLFYALFESRSPLQQPMLLLVDRTQPEAVRAYMAARLYPQALVELQAQAFPELVAPARDAGLLFGRRFRRFFNDARFKLDEAQLRDNGGGGAASWPQADALGARRPARIKQSKVEDMEEDEVVY